MADRSNAGAGRDDPQDLLIELGCEELPPTALDGLREALFTAVCAGLAEAGLGFEPTGSQAFSTPRRLAVLLRRVAAAQPDQELERRGPAVAAAFDATGQPTPAALGFARSVQLPIDQLERLETARGSWLVARVHQPGQPLEALIFPILEQALRQLPIPRPMRWASHDFSFIRPVHWLVVMHGTRVLNGRLLGQTATGETWGHRVHAPGPHRIGQPADYLDVLRAAYVLADPAERKRRICEQSVALEPEVRIEEALLEEVKNLVEWPVPVACTFDTAFLAVPHEALVASMQDHQKFFPVEQSGAADAATNNATTPSRSVSNRFIAVANLESLQVERVREGFERVIRPRLADARFFLEQDQKQPLAAFAAGLEAVVFQSKVGSIGAKSRRIASLSKTIATRLGQDAAACERAGLLAKCDLMSLMVGEFPELQGTMGRHYAGFSGESQAVADAIAEHYQPRFAGDRVPASPAGQIVGIADRADTLVAIFVAGQRPTGNKDPFALRRCALGLVRILLETGAALSLDRLLALAANELAAQDVVAEPALLAELREFVADRARNHFREAGHEAELINAAMASDWDTFADLAARLAALTAFIGLESGRSLAAANKRIGNILRKSGLSPNAEIAEDSLILPEEKALFAELRSVEQTLPGLLGDKDYGRCLEHLALLRPAVDAFFDGVMVMDEDAALRANRLALLARLKAQFDRIADLSVLG